jgi:hypothetical protein
MYVSSDNSEAAFQSYIVKWISRFTPKLKTKWMRQWFKIVSDIQRVLNSNKENVFHGTFVAWRKTKGLLYMYTSDYFEGDSSQN